MNIHQTVEDKTQRKTSITAGININPVGNKLKTCRHIRYTSWITRPCTRVTLAIVRATSRASARPAWTCTRTSAIRLPLTKLRTSWASAGASRTGAWACRRQSAIRSWIGLAVVSRIRVLVVGIVGIRVGRSSSWLSLRIEILGASDFRLGIGVPGFETETGIIRLRQPATGNFEISFSF